VCLLPIRFILHTIILDSPRAKRRWLELHILVVSRGSQVGGPGFRRCSVDAPGRPSRRIARLPQARDNRISPPANPAAL
jgi:hypothetical protein